MSFLHLTLMDVRRARLFGLAAALLFAALALLLPASQQTHAQTPLPTVSVYATETIVIKEGAAASYTIVADPAPTSDLTVSVYIGQSNRVYKKMHPPVGEDAYKSYTIAAGTTHTTFTIQTTDWPDKNLRIDSFPTYNADGLQQPGYLTPVNGPNECGTVTALLLEDETYEIDSPISITVDVYDANALIPGCNVAEGLAERLILDRIVGISPVADITEGSAAKFTVSVDRAPIADFTVNLSVSETSGSNFVAAGDEGDRSVIIAAGDSSATFSVDTTSDSVDEPKGAVTVAIASGTSYLADSDASSASVDVTDDDATPVTLNADTADIPETGGTKTISVALGRQLRSPEALGVTLNFGGGATAGTDYAVNGAGASGVTYGSLSGGSMTVTFTGGDSASANATLTLSATSDADVEGDESVTVSMGALTSASGTNLDGGASGSGGPFTFNITDDDAPAISVSNVVYERYNA